MRCNAARGLVGLVALSAMSVATAAPINFVSTEFIDSTNIDVSLGNVIYAVNGGDSGDVQVVTADGSTVTFESIVDTANATQSNGSTFSSDAPGFYSIPTDQASLDEVLNSHAFDDGAPFDLTLQNLVVGRAYQVQVIGPADTRGCCIAREHTVESADGGLVGNISRNIDFDGDGVSHVMTAFGVFVADAPTQVLTFGGPNNGGYAGIVLTSNLPQVPEPSSLAMIGLGCASLVGLSRRK